MRINNKYYIMKMSQQTYVVKYIVRSKMYFFVYFPHKKKKKRERKN